MKKTLNELQTLRELLWKLHSIIQSGDLEAVQKEVQNQLEVVEFNIKNKKYE